MSKLTAFARGMDCTLRLPGSSPGPDNETVVTCHLPSGRKGMGYKSPDWWSIHACAACHDKLDGRTAVDGATYLDEDILRALFETTSLRTAKGLIKVGL